MSARADLRDGLQEIFENEFWIHSWSVLRDSGSMIPPIDRTIVVSDVFLRANGTHASLIVQFGIGVYLNVSRAASFLDVFDTLSLSQRVVVFFGTNSCHPIHPKTENNSTDLRFDSSLVEQLFSLGIQNITRLPERPCPHGQRPSLIRELSNATVYPSSSFGVPTLPGCEDADECNSIADHALPPPATTIFDRVYPVPEREHDIRTHMRHTFGALHMCETRNITLFLPTEHTTWSNISSETHTHRHVCHNHPPGTYTCECAPGYRQESVPNTVWSTVLGANIFGDHSCVEIDECSEYNVTCGVWGAGTCVDLINDYRCECNWGYENYLDAFPYPEEWDIPWLPWNPAFKRHTCRDVNECNLTSLMNPHGWPNSCGVGWTKAHKCTDRRIADHAGGGYDCVCTPGYVLVAHSQTVSGSGGLITAAGQGFGGFPYCRKLDECGGGACGIGGLCHSRHAYHECSCRNGYREVSVPRSEGGEVLDVSLEWDCPTEANVVKWEPHSTRFYFQANSEAQCHAAKPIIEEFYGRVVVSLTTNLLLAPSNTSTPRTCILQLVGHDATVNPRYPTPQYNLHYQADGNHDFESEEVCILALPHNVTSCPDIDECDPTLNGGAPPCGAGAFNFVLTREVAHTCTTDVAAARTCVCAPGFELVPGTPPGAPRCQPIDIYCGYNPCGPAPNKCHVFVGTFSCECTAGFDRVWSVLSVTELFPARALEGRMLTTSNHSSGINGSSGFFFDDDDGNFSNLYTSPLSPHTTPLSPSSSLPSIATEPLCQPTSGWICAPDSSLAYRVPASTATWFSAEQICETEFLHTRPPGSSGTRHATLATLESAPQAHAALAALLLHNVSEHAGLWFGANDLATEGVWRYAEANQTIRRYWGDPGKGTDFQAWAVAGNHQPDDANGREDCGQLQWRSAASGEQSSETRFVLEGLAGTSEGTSTSSTALDSWHQGSRVMNSTDMVHHRSCLCVSACDHMVRHRRNVCVVVQVHAVWGDVSRVKSAESVLH